MNRKNAENHNQPNRKLETPKNSGYSTIEKQEPCSLSVREIAVIQGVSSHVHEVNK